MRGKSQVHYGSRDGNASALPKQASIGAIAVVLALDEPPPWIAAELGWVVSEYGRQPWAIDGLLPTFLGVSAVPSTHVLLSLTGFVVFYSALAAVDVVLMVRTVRRGPDGLGHWPPPVEEPPSGPVIIPIAAAGSAAARTALR